MVTIHDLIHVRFARLQRPGVGFVARTIAGLAAKRARIVIADSEATRRDVVELLHVDEAKVRVVPLGVSPALRPAAAEAVAALRAVRGLPADYVLYVGARKRHKNLDLLLHAWRAMPAAERPPLVFSGLPWSGGDALARLARTLGIEKQVHFSGALHDEAALASLYSGAALVVQPSLAEGFGLPPLEAMACGVAVLSSDAGSLPEVLGDCAEYLPPHGPEAWASQVLELLGDRARLASLGALGRTHAAMFTWARTARLTRALYHEALGGTSR